VAVNDYPASESPTPSTLVEGRNLVPTEHDANRYGRYLGGTWGDLGMPLNRLEVRGRVGR
jgi:hypothetical protein